MSRKEYQKFRLAVNIMVFLAFLLSFVLVEIKYIRYSNFLDNILAALALSSIFLMLGIMTVMPHYAAYVGRTFIVFSSLMILVEAYWISRIGFDIISIIRLSLALVLLLYGIELKSGKTRLISLKALAGI